MSMVQFSRHKEKLCKIRQAVAQGLVSMQVSECLTAIKVLQTLGRELRRSFWYCKREIFDALKERSFS